VTGLPERMLDLICLVMVVVLVLTLFGAYRLKKNLDEKKVWESDTFASDLRYEILKVLLWT